MQQAVACLHQAGPPTFTAAVSMRWDAAYCVAYADTYACMALGPTDPNTWLHTVALFAVRRRLPTAPPSAAMATLAVMSMVKKLAGAGVDAVGGGSGANCTCVMSAKVARTAAKLRPKSRGAVAGSVSCMRIGNGSGLPFSYASVNVRV